MPLTLFQAALARLLSGNRTEDSHLAGGAALHLPPNGRRYSNDLDYFHDSTERVATAFHDDEVLLRNNGYEVQIDIRQPGYIRAVVRRGAEGTKVEWAHDSAWRFMPVVKHVEYGYLLHPIDLALNKTLALAGRDEARDFLDILYIHDEVLTLGALCWAVPGKDPGFTPLSLLELLRRRGKYRPEDFERLHLTAPVSLPEFKAKWLYMLDHAEAFIRTRPASDLGCLYYDSTTNTFVEPKPNQAVHLHFGRPGGVLPRVHA